MAKLIANLQLSDAEKFMHRDRDRRSSDNVGPAIFWEYGHRASYIGEDVQYVTADLPSCDLWLFVPSYQLKTSGIVGMSYRKNGLIRKQLQQRSHCCYRSSPQGRFADLAGRSIESDHFHERYSSILSKSSLRSKKSRMRMGLTPPICREQAQRSRTS